MRCAGLPTTGSKDRPHRRLSNAVRDAPRGQPNPLDPPPARPDATSTRHGPVPLTLTRQIHLRRQHPSWPPPRRKKPIGGAKNGKAREVPEVKAPKYYPADDIKPKVASERDAASKGIAKLKKGLKPGSVLIMLGGRFRGKRVIFLKQLSSGLLLVTGPYQVNGVPLRRVNQAYCIATSASVDVAKADVKGIDDAFFARAKKKKDDEFFGEEAKVRSRRPLHSRPQRRHQGPSRAAATTRELSSGGAGGGPELQAACEGRDAVLHAVVPRMLGADAERELATGPDGVLWRSLLASSCREGLGGCACVTAAGGVRQLVVAVARPWTVISPVAARRSTRDDRSLPSPDRDGADRRGPVLPLAEGGDEPGARRGAEEGGRRDHARDQEDADDGQIPEDALLAERRRCSPPDEVLSAPQSCTEAVSIVVVLCRSLRSRSKIQHY